MKTNECARCKAIKQTEKDYFCKECKDSIVIRTPIKAIRRKCLDCCAYQPKEVKLCVVPDCPLYPYRLGHRPEKPTATRGFSERKNERSDNIWVWNNKL